jgi:hypothetical protein
MLGVLARSARGASERCTPLARSSFGASERYTPLARSPVEAVDFGAIEIRATALGLIERGGTNALLSEFMCA